MLDKRLCDKSAISRDWLAWWIHNQIRHRLPKCHYANVKLNPLVFCLHKLVTLFSRKFLAGNESRKQRNKTSQIKSKRRYQAGSSQKSSADRCSWALVNQSCLPCHLIIQGHTEEPSQTLDHPNTYQSHFVYNLWNLLILFSPRYNGNERTSQEQGKQQKNCKRIVFASIYQFCNFLWSRIGHDSSTREISFTT